MNSVCDECKGKCCQGIIDVYSSDEIFYDDTLVCEAEDAKYDRRMKTVENNRCIALKDGKCTIYEMRPQVCRLFEVGSRCCENFHNGHLNAHTCFPCPISERVSSGFRKVSVMNRVIKFRVWNGVEFCGNISIGHSVDKNDYEKWDDLVFQQFTGFTDRNGKEIYEGDIFKKSVYKWEPVEFENGQWQANLQGCRVYSLYELFYDVPKGDYPEVVGNIFENPELL